ncbi:MAG: hypothetical protein HONBIEJF_01067 [Fimbriimonadaceae bacterium]|nr:hypothetical protein [Fimbriimonadaceae bacterium]
MKEVFRDTGRFLTFRATQEDYERFGYRHFLLGFLTTWAVGIARNWDYPEAELFAKAGLPSLAYIFLLSLLLFAFAWPVSYEKQNYWKFLTVVSMTAAPGLIYGIPVEMFLSTTGAQNANLAFLGFVALWRVALMVHFLFVAAGNTILTTMAVLLTPLSIMIVGLISTGRAGYIMDIMGGLRSRGPSHLKAVDETVAFLGCLAWPVGVCGLLVLALPSLIAVATGRVCSPDP